MASFVPRGYATQPIAPLAVIRLERGASKILPVLVFLGGPSHPAQRTSS